MGKASAFTYLFLAAPLAMICASVALSGSMA